MRDLLTIIIVERRTLIRGWMIFFFLALPFTFLPAVIKNGLTREMIFQRFPDAMFYSVGFSLFIVMAAIFNNYNSLVDRKRIFDRPAFVKLDFHGRIGGVGSVVNELETFLLGKIGGYYFRLKIIEPEVKKIKIEVVPLIDLDDNKTLTEKLKSDFGFKQDEFFAQMMMLTEEELENENLLLDRLVSLEKVLKDLGAKHLEIDESKLEE